MRTRLIAQIPTVCFTLIIWLIPLFSSSQQILSALHIERGGSNDGYEYLIRDTQGNYYVGLEFEPDLEGIQLSDTFLTANRIDNPPTNLRFNDFYYIKFSPDHSFLGYFVADNISFIPDFYSSGEYNAIVLNHYFDNGQVDSDYPIIIQDSISIFREGHRRQGTIILLDENLLYKDNITISSGWLGQVVIDGDFLYVQCVIQEDEPYILIGIDTVYNAVWPDGQPGNENVVICKYDIDSESVIWHKSIGDAGTEQLFEMSINIDHNLVVHGHTSSRNFTFNGIDTIENQSEHNPFIGVYNPDGDLLSGILNQNLVNDTCDDFITDNEGNFYLAGFYYGPEYRIGDTIVYNPLQGEVYSFRPIIKKYDAQGKFVWIHQLEGSGDGFFNEVMYKDGVIIASGLFVDGTLTIGNDVYTHDHGNGIHNAFLVKFDPETGSYISHAYTEGINKRWFYDLYPSIGNYLDAYLLVLGPSKVFNLDLSNLSENNFHGHVIRMTTDFISNTSEIMQQDMFEIFPNPVRSVSEVNVRIDQKLESPVNYSLFNIHGSLIDQKSFSHHDNVLSIALPEIPTGIYFLTLQSSNNRFTQKLVVE